MKKKTLVISVLILLICTLNSNAQWAVGLSGGWDWNSPSIDKGYATDVTYQGRSGWNVGLVGRYQFLNWLAVRADLKVSTRSYEMNRNYPGFEEIYTKHRDTYLHLPVMADFSVGGKKLRGHAYLGAYIGGWLDAHRSGNAMMLDETAPDDKNVIYPFDESEDFDSRRDNRFNAGLIGGLGLSYLINKHFEVMVEGFYMYDLSKSNKTYMISNPRYNSTTDVNVGVMYNF